ncbi:nuclear transport factor 2 family protein [bacterium]|nr:nuclear transport factor 2 family protein [bacterium]
MGRSGPQTGDWLVRLLSNGKLQLQIYAPELSSPVRLDNGWHLFRTKLELQPAKDYWISIVLADGDCGVIVDGLTEVRESLPVSLSGSPLFAGDHPVDDQFKGFTYAELHPAASASLDIVYFGPFAANVGASDYARSVIRRETHGERIAAGPAQPLVTGAADLRESITPGAALDAGLGAGAGTGAGRNEPLRISAVGPFASPEAALRSFLQAQVAGDVPALMGHLWLDGVEEQRQRRAQRLFSVVANRLRFGELELEVTARVNSRLGRLAVLRFRHSLQIEGAEGGLERFGTFALLRRDEHGWKVVELSSDPLQNMLLEDAQRAAPGGRAVALGFGLPGPATPREPEAAGLLDYNQINELFQRTVNETSIDEAKLWYDAHFSAAGWIPGIGDVISAGYTALDTTKTLFTEVIPDYISGDQQMFELGMQQVVCGVVQIAVEVGPGIDSLADGVGAALEQHKYAIKQSRNFDRLRAAMLFTNLSAWPKYLFLRESPLHADSVNGQSDLRLEYYDDWPGTLRPIKKIVFESDVPLRVWKYLDFDIGFLMRIRSSENESLFNAAQALGLKVRTLGNPAMHDYEVALPIRLPTVGPRRTVVDGELSGDVLALDPAREVAASVQTTGMPILQKARLRGEDDPRDRCLRLDISPTSGPDQVLQLKLLIAQGALTEPLTIENAVYNDVSGVIQSENGRLLPDAPAGLTIGVGQELALNLLGRTSRYPPPRIIGWPVSEWRIEDSEVASLKQQGEFPNAFLLLRGLKPGHTQLHYLLYAGLRPDQEPLSGSLEIEVFSGGWLLREAKISSVPRVLSRSSDAQFTSLEPHDGQVYGSGAAYLPGDSGPSCVLGGTVSWTPPPARVTQSGTSWNCRVSMKLEMLDQSRLSNACLEAGRGLMLWNLGGSEAADGGFGAASTSFSVRLGELASIAEEESFSMSELLEEASAGGRQATIRIEVSTPGGGAWVDYIYEKSGGQ